MPSCVACGKKVSKDDEYGDDIFSEFVCGRKECMDRFNELYEDAFQEYALSAGDKQ